MRALDEFKGTKNRNHECCYPTPQISDTPESLFPNSRADIPTQHKGPQSILILKSFELKKHFATVSNSIGERVQKFDIIDG